ncbi:unnamed protein product [Pleuronectes platessa]|uniref:Uncharacterized protein n=1 Tax=Pleuronectes platessa TaxID=8262 RepID=A0A9N7VNZ3_PLEPL|nr:unnamed protein product [Pleuronectes platessa]
MTLRGACGGAGLHYTPCLFLDNELSATLSRRQRGGGRLCSYYHSQKTCVEVKTHQTITGSRWATSAREIPTDRASDTGREGVREKGGEGGGCWEEEGDDAEEKERARSRGLEPTSALGCLVAAIAQFPSRKYPGWWF